MAELVVYSQDETYPLGEMVEDLREGAADFIGRLAARAGLADKDDVPGEIAVLEATTATIEPHIVYAEEDKKEEKKPQRPARPQRSPAAVGHDPSTCRMTVCSSCNKLGHPK